MYNFFDLLFSTFKTNFPNISWKLGSLVRTLLISPMSKVSSAVSDVLIRADRLAELKAALDRPEDYEDTLDYWLDVLGNSTPEPRPATGAVMFVLSNTDKLTIPKNTELTWGDSEAVFTTDAIYVGESQSTPIIKLGTRSYGVVVNVTTAGASDLSLASGLKLNWSDAPSNVVDIYVSSPVCGGGSYTDVYTKAALVSAKLDELSLVSSKGLTSILVSRYLPTIVSAEVSKTTNSSTPVASMSVCLKQRRPPTVELTERPVTTDQHGASYITLSSAGLSSILYIRDRSTGAELTYTTSTDEIDPSILRVTLTDVPTTTTSVLVSLSRFEDITEPLSWLSSANSTLPLNVTPRSPIAVNVAVHLTPSSGSISTETKSAIVDYICSTKLNESIDAGRIASILSKQGVTLARPVLLVGSSYGVTAGATVCSSTGLSPISFNAATDTPVAFYTASSDIQVL